MLCESTRTLLVSILRSLETPDHAEWDDQIESGKQCLYEMYQMTRPSYKAYKASGSDKWPTHIPDSHGLHRAMPHVKAMVRAIRHRDRATAVESGKAALAEMNGVAPPVSLPCFTEPKTESKEPANVVRQHQKLIGKRRAVVAHRPPSRRCRVAKSN